MKLELKHLAPYFVHELECMVEYEINENQIVNLLAMSNGMISVSKKSFPYSENLQLCDIKPILKSPSDLAKDEDFLIFCKEQITCADLKITHDDLNDFISIETLGDDDELLFVCGEIASECPYLFYQWLIEHHFDVFGLIEKGLAINIKNL